MHTLLDSSESRYQTFMQLSVWTRLDPDIHMLLRRQGFIPLMRKKSQLSNETAITSRTFRTMVQVIHTTSTTGAWYTIGTSDFFMNNGFMGLWQPGCWDLGCSHRRSAEYYAESINSFEFKVQGTYMGGEPLATNATGNYNLNTNFQSQFAKG